MIRYRRKVMSGDDDAAPKGKTDRSDPMYLSSAYRDRARWRTPHERRKFYTHAPVAGIKRLHHPPFSGARLITRLSLTVFVSRDRMVL